MSEILLEDLFKAYYDARRNKRNTANQLKFEIQMEDNLLSLYHQLEERTYRPGRSVAFIIDEPVKREVFAAGFSDRVIHHLYFNYVNEIFERSFIDDSYSCRKGRGTSYGIKRLEHHIRSCSRNYTRETWILKLDLSGYFMSIDRQKLYDKVVATLNKYADRRNLRGELYREALDYDLLMFLTRVIIFHDPLEDCFIKSDLSEWEGLPNDKSLFTSAPGTGLPIGNLTSQLFSNVYLNDFDQWIKRTLKVRHYGRYVDDFYLIDTSNDVLTDALTRIREYLRENIGIKLHPHKIYRQPVVRGVQFLGAIIKPYRIYMAKRTVRNFKRAMARGDKFYRHRPRQLLEVLNSYLGLMMHHKTYKLRKFVLDKNGWIFRFGWLDARRRRMREEHRRE
jgi:retron-type reverse transcriptase